jgi:hypothetical protein
MAEQPTHSVTAIDQILGPGTQVELIFDVNLIKDFIDVRTATVLEMVDDYIIITQASPPALKSMVGSSPEATFVRRDSVTGEVLRWGWRTQIEEIVENYRPKPIDDLPHDEQPMTALIISCPSVGGLTATNALFRLPSVCVDVYVCWVFLCIVRVNGYCPVCCVEPFVGGLSRSICNFL